MKDDEESDEVEEEKCGVVVGGGEDIGGRLGGRLAISTATKAQ